MPFRLRIALAPMTRTTTCAVIIVCAAAGALTVRQCGRGSDGSRQGAVASTSHTAASTDGTHISGQGDRAKSPRSHSLIKPRLDEAGRSHLLQGPEAVLSAHSAGDGASWSNADDDLLVAWAAQDPEAALKWIRSGDRAVAFGQLLGAVAAGILIKDGKEEMQRFLAEHQNDSDLPPKDQGEELENRLFYHLGREDTIDVAMELLVQSTNASLAGMMVAGIDGTQYKISAIDRLEAKGIPVTIDYWTLQNAVDEDPRFWSDWAWQRNSDLLEDTLTTWHRQNPAEVKQWIEERIPTNDPRRTTIDEMIQTREAPLPDEPAEPE